ncbi:MAG: dCTP deaminase [Candidatus Hadarchaeum sp.]|uniref:dCTP deaminase n=1 Tax=Candidatus Hadarchaeum sp. TaxID=2883567 RepID=UPI00316E1345
MPLSDCDILREMSAGNIIIEPFDRRKLQPNGYDLSIGPIFYTFNNNIDGFFPFIKESVDMAYVRNEAQETTLRVGKKIVRGKFIRLPPHGFVIASTLERVGTKKDIVASIRCRSSLARTGIDIVRGAGWGDVGFDGVWTIEITNHLPVPYYLPVGLRIGQMVFFRTETPPEKPYQGKYSGSTEPALPKLYADKDLATLIEIEESP